MLAQDGRVVAVDGSVLQTTATSHRWCLIPLRVWASWMIWPTTLRDSASVISSDDECLVRPNVGRDVAARTARSDEQVRPTLMDGASPNCLGSGVRSEIPDPNTP